MNAGESFDKKTEITAFSLMGANIVLGHSRARPAAPYEYLGH
jgi:hypothetical protein